MTAPTNVAASSVCPATRPSLRRAQATQQASSSEARAALSVAASRIAGVYRPLRGGTPAPRRASGTRLITAPWTLVDTFEHGGKRYLVAQHDVDAATDLSPRERTVLAAAAAGHHDKLIAHDLGLADSTVRVLLFRARRKLGAASRAEAITCFRATTRRV
ncbi:hypothetical protein BH11MYX4_BH11MYX4_01600 [soil metagenome]